MSPTVHVLYHGFVLCGAIHGIPRDWGAGHRWVSAFDGSWREHATCSECRRAAWMLDIVRDRPRHEQMLPPAGPVEEETE